MDGPCFCRSAGEESLDLRQPSIRTLPLVLASPHSGAEYPDGFLAASRLDPLTLRRSEDSFVDELFAAGPGLGAPLLAGGV
jgi:N-formylglutamate deformylase